MTAALAAACLTLAAAQVYIVEPPPTKGARVAGRGAHKYSPGDEEDADDDGGSVAMGSTGDRQRQDLAGKKTAIQRKIASLKGQLEKEVAELRRIDSSAQAGGIIQTPMTKEAINEFECKLDGASANIDKLGIQMMFPTFVLTHTLVRDQQTFEFNKQIKELMLELEEENDGCTANLHGGYRSKDGFLTRQEPAVRWLHSEILPRVQMMLGFSDSAHLKFKIEGWGAVLRVGHGQQMHVHPGAMFAGVYYVAAPRGLGDDEKSHEGCIFFQDPRAGATMAQVTRGKNIYGESFEVCPPERGGLLILFPSWLMHEVVPMSSKFQGPRIAISFNVIFDAHASAGVEARTTAR